MRIDVLTLFPDIFSGFVSESILNKAIQRDLVSIQVHNFRDWAEPPHYKMDDRPYGGGPGMVMMAPPVVAAVEQVKEETSQHSNPRELILFTPVGERLTQPIVEQFASRRQLILVCGRYEGFDQRVVDVLQPRLVSLGDFVLNGGETAAMALIDAVIRLIPGVLGDEQSSVEDSFSSGNRWLEYPHYTRPPEFRGHKVPAVLQSGNHAAIKTWREQRSLELTRKYRQDLLKQMRPAESD